MYQNRNSLLSRGFFAVTWFDLQIQLIYSGSYRAYVDWMNSNEKEKTDTAKKFSVCLMLATESMNAVTFENKRMWNYSEDYFLCIFFSSSLIRTNEIAHLCVYERYNNFLPNYYYLLATGHCYL